MLGVIAEEVTRVNGDAANNPGQAETDDAPVEPGGASPAALPPVHPFSAIGVFAFAPNGCARLQQILFGCKEIVVGKQHRSTKFFRSEDRKSTRLNSSHGYISY